MVAGGVNKGGQFPEMGSVVILRGKEQQEMESRVISISCRGLPINRDRLRRVKHCLKMNSYIQAVLELFLVFYITIVPFAFNIGDQEKCFISILVKFLSSHVCTGTGGAVDIDFFVFWDFSKT